MIPLSYNDTKLGFYYKFVSDFKDYLAKAVKKGYLGNRCDKKVSDWKSYYAGLNAYQQTQFKAVLNIPDWSALPEGNLVKCSDKILDEETKKFFEWLLEKEDDEYDRLDKLVDAPAEELPNRISVIKNSFSTFTKDEAKPLKSKSALYKLTLEAFKDYAYVGKLDKGKLFEATNATVCPYCNRVFIANVRTTRREKNDKIQPTEIRGELDHFYSKDTYPYLAISRYNLVPSCPFCNHTKSDGDSSKLVNPYCLDSHEHLRFDMAITGSGFANMETCAKAITIAPHPDEVMKGNVEMFHIEDIYKTHTDYAAEIYYKHILPRPLEYKEYVSKFFASKGMPLNAEDEQRLLLGIFTPSEFSKRPLSKLRYDLAKKYGLIDE